MHAVYQLGLLAMASGKWERSARLFETADRQAQSISATRLSYIVCAGISRHLDGDIETAEQHILRANSIIRSDKKEASSLLMKLGESFLRLINQDWHWKFLMKQWSVHLKMNQKINLNLWQITY